jgi:integrase
MPFHNIKKGAIRDLLNQPGKHADGRGLYLQVAKPGQASWTTQFRLAGQTKWMTIGPANLFTIDEARDRHALIRKAVKDGIDPRRAGAGEVRGASFGEALSSYLSEASPDWRGGADGKEANHYRACFARISDFTALPVETIGLLETRAALKTWAAQPVTQRKMKTRIGAVINFAKTGEIRSKKLLPDVEHHTPMPIDDIPRFMADLSRVDPADQLYRPSQALAFLVLTAGRTAETLGITWSEIQEPGAEPGYVLVIEGDRMKSGKRHRVPLSSAAVALIGPRGPDAEFVFASKKAGSIRAPTKPWASALREVLELVRPGSDYDVHGFRSSFRDWAGEKTEFPDALAEIALAHSVGAAIQKAYKHGDALDRRRSMMEAWGDYCLSRS